MIPHHPPFAADLRGALRSFHALTRKAALAHAPLSEDPTASWRVRSLRDAQATNKLSTRLLEETSVSTPLTVHDITIATPRPLTIIPETTAKTHETITDRSISSSIVAAQLLGAPLHSGEHFGSPTVIAASAGAGLLMVTALLMIVKAFRRQGTGLSRSIIDIDGDFGGSSPRPYSNGWDDIPNNFDQLPNGDTGEQEKVTAIHLTTLVGHGNCVTKSVKEDSKNTTNMDRHQEGDTQKSQDSNMASPRDAFRYITRLKQYVNRSSSADDLIPPPEEKKVGASSKWNIRPLKFNQKPVLCENLSSTLPVSSRAASSSEDWINPACSRSDGYCRSDRDEVLLWDSKGSAMTYQTVESVCSSAELVLDTQEVPVEEHAGLIQSTDDPPEREPPASENSDNAPSDIPRSTKVMQESQYVVNALRLDNS